MRRWSPWYKTGECRIVPWYFGLMRAEFMWRRDRYFDDSEEIDVFQLKALSAGRLPAEMDGSGAFGFWSTLASTYPLHGERGLWRKFISWFPIEERNETTKKKG